jgi:hypothetical protein
MMDGKMEFLKSRVQILRRPMQPSMPWERTTTQKARQMSIQWQEKRQQAAVLRTRTTHCWREEIRRACGLPKSTAAQETAGASCSSQELELGDEVNQQTERNRN